jgi:hypothetical protein
VRRRVSAHCASRDAAQILRGPVGGASWNIHQDE